MRSFFLLKGVKMFNLKLKNQKRNIIQKENNFIKNYGVQEQISFKNDYFVKTDSGYETCIYVYRYP